MRYKASVTVFFSLSVLMIMSLIFSLVEVVHFTGLKDNTVTVTQMGIESIFAQYNRFLWKEYDILAVDGGFSKSRLDIEKLEMKMAEYINDNLNPEKNMNLLRATPNELKLAVYGLLTDQGGAAFIKEASKSGILSSKDTFLTSWSNTAEEISSGGLPDSSVEDLLINGKKGLENAKEQEDGETPEAVVPVQPVEENPIDVALSWKAMTVLSQVIKDVGSISRETIGNDRLSRRGINAGNGEAVNISTVEKTLCGLYLRNKFSSYRIDRGHGGLRYEWEHVINGKDSDIKNLEATISKLIALREAQNIISVMTDPEKVAICLGIATALCAVVPFLIEPVKWGIMAAWAYLESVLDVRLLLNGGKVPMVKNPMEWTSSIHSFANYFDASVTAKDVGHGMSYEDYLTLMTFALFKSDLGLRSLEVIEKALNNNPDYVNCRMDNFIFCGKTELSYNATPVFASIMPMLAGKLDSYNFKRTGRLSYI